MTKHDEGQSSMSSTQLSSAKDLQWQGMWLGWVGLLCLAVFHWMPFSYWRMMGWPWILIWQAGFFSLGIWLVWMLRQFDVPFRRLGYGLDWLLGITTLVMLLSAAFSPFPQLAIWNVVLAGCFGLLIYVVRNFLGGSVDLQRWFWLGLCLTGIITGVISLAMWQPSLEMFQAGDFSAAIRNARPLGHHNFVGGYLVLILPVVFAFAQAHKGWQRWVGWVGVAVLTLGLLVSGSRGAGLGFIVWLLVTLSFLIGRSQGTQRRTMIAVSLAALLLISAGLLANPRTRTLITNFRENNDSPVDVATIGDGPTRDRLFMMQLSANIIKDRPILGIGPGNMVRVSNLYRPIDAGRGLSGIQQLHNTPVQLMGELGLAGLALYAAFIVVVGRLWWQLQHKAQGGDRLFAYGIGGGFLAYGISSLTDYQLENIGIASFLALYVVALVHLADVYDGSGIGTKTAAGLPIRLRRMLSLGAVALLAAFFSVWLPISGALYFGRMATHDFNMGRYGDAERKWDVAAEMHRHDPTYDAIAGQQMLDLKAGADSTADQQALKEAAVEHFNRALALSPTDIHFNQNLAVLTLADSPETAEVYASRAAQLLTRSDSYTYYLLAQVHLAQNQPAAAATALLLQSLTNPGFLTMPMWGTAPLAELHQPVTEAFIAEYSDILRNLSPGSIQYASLYESLQLICWWHQLACPTDLPEASKRPIIEALLLIEEDADQALEVVNQALLDPAQRDDWESLSLLRFWLDPEQYSVAHFQEHVDSDLTSEDIESITSHIKSHRDLREWLVSLTQPVPEPTREVLFLSYRNQSASLIRLALLPEGLDQYGVANLLGLFALLPREVPLLDNRIDQIRTEQLNLPHPVRNNFQLTHNI